MVGTGLLLNVFTFRSSEYCWYLLLHKERIPSTDIFTAFFGLLGGKLAQLSAEDISEPKR